MQRSGVGLLLALALLLGGCNKSNEPTGSSIPPGGPSGAPGPGGPPGPSGPAGMPGAPGGVQPAGPSAMAGPLTAKVKNALMTTKGLNTAKVRVDTTADGVATLSGSVPAAEQKTLAEKTAKHVQGVKAVRNQLTVAK